MTPAQISPDSPDRLLTPQQTVDYLQTHYGIKISLPSLYSMINRKDAP